MDDATANPNFIQAVEHFQRHDVAFFVIGGQAAILHGSPLPSFDIDLCYRRTPENLEKLATALKNLHPTRPSRFAIPTGRGKLRPRRHFHFQYRPWAAQPAGPGSPFGSYDDLIGRAEKIPLETFEVAVISE